MNFNHLWRNNKIHSSAYPVSQDHHDQHMINIFSCNSDDLPSFIFRSKALAIDKLRSYNSAQHVVYRVTRAPIFYDV